MKPEGSVERHQTLSSRVGSGHETREKEEGIEGEERASTGVRKFESSTGLKHEALTALTKNVKNHENYQSFFTFCTVCIVLHSMHMGMSSA